MTEHVHDAACRPPWRPWPPRECSACGALECVVGSMFVGCQRCGETGGADHPGHGAEGPVGDMKGPLLCLPCFDAWLRLRGLDASQQGLGL